MFPLKELARKGLNWCLAMVNSPFVYPIWVWVASYGLRHRKRTWYPKLGLGTIHLPIRIGISWRKWVNWKQTAQRITWWITERTCLILITHSTKYIWQAFYKFNVFRQVCTMMIMRWCKVHINEYDRQAKTYPTICTHHKLHKNNENKFPVFPECICNK